MDDMTNQQTASPKGKNTLMAFLILALIASLGAGLFFYRRAAAAGAEAKTAKFNMTTRAIVSDIPKGAKELDLWMLYPQDRPNQVISNIRVKSPYPVEINYEKEYGNPILHVRVENPRRDFKVAINFDVLRTENNIGRSAGGQAVNSRKRNNSPDFKKWMRYDKVGTLTPMLQGLSDRLTRGKKSDVAKAKAIYDYIVKTYIYDFNKKYLPKERGNLSLFCKTKKGRCTELSTLFGTLARAAGIPVKYVSGYVVRNLESGDIGGHCCWVEFFAQGIGWIPVDAATAKKFPQDSDYYFGNTDEWRIELVTGRDLILEPPQKGPRINAWINPYAEVDGEIFLIGKRVSWVKK